MKRPSKEQFDAMLRRPRTSGLPFAARDAAAARAEQEAAARRLTPPEQLRVGMLVTSHNLTQAQAVAQVLGERPERLTMSDLIRRAAGRR